MAKAKAQTVLFRIILFTVSMVIISLVIYTFTMEKIRSIAVMKLIGAPNWVIIRMVLEESLLLTCSLSVRLDPHLQHLPVVSPTSHTAARR